MLFPANNDTNLGELLLTHVSLLAGVAVAGQLTALETVAGAVVAPLRVDTVVLARTVPVVGDALVGVHTAVTVLAQLLPARSSSRFLCPKESPAS